MENLLQNVKIKVNQKLYLKDPETTELGKKILDQSVDLIHEMGIEQFTFRKLAKKMGTTESSIYRYFENKHTLFLYLFSWYWGWIEYRLVFSIQNIDNAADKLYQAIKVMCKPEPENSTDLIFSFPKLKKILIEESSKAYLTKQVEAENKAGYYSAFKRVTSRLSELVLEINPAFKYPKAAASLIQEGILHQQFYAQHLPALTDLNEDNSCVECMFYSFIENIIKVNN